MKRFFYSFIILSVTLFTACKKTPKSDTGNGRTGGTTTISPNDPGTTLNKIQDSVFLYCKEDYLWYNSLPTYAAFNPRSSTFTGADDETTLTNELNKISQIAINPATGEPYEYYDSAGDAKYSFIDNGQVAAELNGNRGDFGFGLKYNLVNDLRISYVYPGSPADQAGIKRGYQVTSIDGSTSISYDGGSYGNGTNLNFVNNAFTNSNTITMTLLKPDGTTMTVTNLAIANYTVNPVLKYTTFTEPNGHIVGYIVFNSFTSDANADPQLNTAFNYFITQGVTDLVVDLRYNGGGYVSTAEYLDNLIVPAAKSGTLMYNTYYNNILQNGQEVLLKNQWRQDPATGQDYNYGQFDYSVAGNVTNFSKQLTLSVNQVFFIITGSTASASELTINNLRPEMPVQFIGETSYGKPVGFFDIDINVYQMYTPEFYTQNSAGQGGYYQGFTPGTTAYPGIEDYDDLTKEFGDPTEGLLAHALNYVSTGTFSVKTKTIQSLPGQRTLSMQAQNEVAKSFEIKKFNGMVMNKRLKFKKPLK